MYLNYPDSILALALFRLTLTWDVFKYVMTTTQLFKVKRLTLTWDVFKYYTDIYWCVK